MGGARRRHTVVVVCVCEWVSVSFREILFAFSPQSLNIKDWNVQCKLNAMLSWNKIGEFWIRDFIVELCQQSRVERRTNPSQQAVVASRHHQGISTYVFFLIVWISNKFSRLCSVVITVHSPLFKLQILIWNLWFYKSMSQQKVDFFVNFIIIKFYKMVAIL